MPAWWGRRSHKSKEESNTQQQQTLVCDSPNAKFFHSNSDKNRKRSPRSSDESGPGILSPNLVRNSRELGSSGGGFSGFDSDGGGERKVVGHPLPLPVNSGLVDHAVGLSLQSGSASVSSNSSHGSNSDDLPPLDHPPFGPSSTRARSPGPGSRTATAAASPLHPRLAGSNLESPTGSSLAHPLPLPPSSPSSPSLPNGRAGIHPENTHNSPSKWKKGKLLGRGTFGHVYLGFNSESGHMCAIKEVSTVSDDQNSRESLKQLSQEINLLSQLSHPNIVRYYGSDLAEDTLSVYLEYVSGGSIHKLLQEYGPFKEPVIQSYTRQILSGLAYLHSRNTVHRDIKGANILVDPNGEIKLADFGMAKHIKSCNSVLSFKGSPYWMAPEVVMNTNGHGGLAVDIWSLGCTILEMATSKPPWSQYEGVAAIFKIGNSKDTPEIPDFLSNEAKNFLKLCLQRDPSARPSASQLLEHSFVKEQTVGRIPNMNATTEALPFSFDGSHKPQPLDIQPRRKSISSYDTDIVRRPGMTIWDAREHPRSITSLPVSPCSSPLRQLGTASKSLFLSPPHQSYAWPRQGGYNLSNHSISPTRRSVGFIMDPWIETTLFKNQTPPGGSPQMQLR